MKRACVNRRCPLQRNHVSEDRVLDVLNRSGRKWLTFCDARIYRARLYAPDRRTVSLESAEHESYEAAATDLAARWAWLAEQEAA